MKIKCPICNRYVVSAWECCEPGDNPRWFAGVYGCGKCGAMKLSGKLDELGQARPCTVIPECPNHHGTTPVVQLSATRWRCTACNAEISREDGRLMYSSTMGWADLDGVLLAVEAGGAA